MATPARIVAYSLHRFGRIRLAQLDLDKKGNLIVIAGRNKQGKSTLIDGLLTAISGKPNRIREPIQQGENNCLLEVTARWDGRDLQIMREFSRDALGQTTSKVHVLEGGKPLPNPGQVLKGLIGANDIDPLKFLDMQPADQRKHLLKLCGLDLDGWKKRKDAALAERKAAEKEAETAERAARDVVVPDGTPDEEVDVAELSQRQADMIARANARDTAVKAAEKAQSDVRELEEQLRQAHEALKVASALAAEASKLASDDDLESVKAQLASATTVNTNVQNKRQREKLRQAFEAKKAEFVEADKQVKSLDQEQLDMLSKAKFPAEGLGFDDDGVTLHGVPLDQASGAERMLAACSIALANESDLRVLVVENGESLDDDSLKDLAKIADDLDAQVFVHRVLRFAGDPAGNDADFLVEEGEVTSF